MTKYLFICSAGHSGSTLLDLLIGTHSRVASLGEIDQLSKNIALNTQCSCGEQIRSCPVWATILLRIGEQLGVDVITNPYVLNMGLPKASTVIDRDHQTLTYLIKRKLVLGAFYLQTRFGMEFLTILTRQFATAAQSNLRVFDAVRQELAADTVVDSSKSYLKAVSLYRADPDNVRIILLTRDGRGVCWSNVKRGVSRRDAIAAWRNQYRRALPLLARNVDPSHVLQVKYEDIVASAEQELARICDFIGLQFEPGMLDFRSKVHHVANGNDMRMGATSQLRADTQWREKLTVEDLRYFEEKAGQLNRQLGYL